MKIDLAFAELHNPLFFNAKNFGTKLDPARFGGITLIYDDDTQMLEMTWNKKVAWVPMSNIASMTPGVYEPRKEVNIHHTQVAGMGHAQVSTPFSHVHAGPGKGKTK